MTFETEYNSLAELGPKTRHALTYQCIGKWSAFGVLGYIGKMILDPKADDDALAAKILRLDRQKMGVRHG